MPPVASSISWPLHLRPSGRRYISKRPSNFCAICIWALRLYPISLAVQYTIPYPRSFKQYNCGRRFVEPESSVRGARGEGVLRRFRALPFWVPLEARPFRRLWGGSGLSMVADQAFLVALTWLVLRVTGSGAELGLVLAVASIPGTILTPAGGGFIHRDLPPLIMIWTSAGSGFFFAPFSGL